MHQPWPAFSFSPLRSNCVPDCLLISRCCLAGVLLQSLIDLPGIAECLSGTSGEGTTRGTSSLAKSNRMPSGTHSVHGAHPAALETSGTSAMTSAASFKSVGSFSLPPTSGRRRSIGKVYMTLLGQWQKGLSPTAAAKSSISSRAVLTAAT